MTQTPGSDQISAHFAVSGIPRNQGLALAQMLSARLSHDLAGLVGSLVGTLELANSDPEAFAMAQETALALNGRLKLLRAAFGAAEQNLSFAEIAELLRALPVSRRVSLNLTHMPPSRVWRATEARLLLCVTMLAVESLAGEGEVLMQRAEDGTVLLAAIGPRAIWPAGFVSFLTDPATALEHATDQGPRGILAPLVALLAEAAGARIAILIGPHSETAPPLIITFAG